jgi:SnoaL-like protein
MTLRNLPVPLSVFLLALERRDTAALYSTLSDNAVLLDQGKRYEGMEIRSWSDALCADPDFVMCPVYSTHAGEFTTLVLLLAGIDGPAGSVSHAQWRWQFRISGKRISAITVSPEPLPAMPAVISVFIRAVNTGDLGALLATFAEDALVNGQLCEYRGRQAVSACAARDVIGEKLTLYVIEAVQQHGHVVLRAHVDGTFERRGLPDPLVLALYFSAQGDEIVQLIILRRA